MNKNYNKIMEEVRLSEVQKDDILSHVLAKQEKPRGFVWWKALGAIATVVVISLLLTNGVSFGAHSGAASGTPTESAAATVTEEARENILMDSGVMAAGVEHVNYQYEVLMGEYEIYQIDHMEKVNGLSVYVIEKGKEAMWIKEGQTHHLTLEEPMEEDEFIEFIKSFME